MPWFVMNSDENWREEMIAFTTDERHIKLLREGPRSLTDSWMLNGMKQKWKKIVGWKDPEPPNCQSSFKEWNEETKSL